MAFFFERRQAKRPTRAGMQQTLGLFTTQSCGITPGTMPALATYIHNLDPIIFDVPGTPLAIRWYGLAYVAGFTLGYIVLRWLTQKKLFQMDMDKLGDYVTLVCILGVLIGGRLGEFFFYWLPENGLSGFMADPLWVFRVWEGGMASHGGILGVGAASLWFAWRNKISVVKLLDGIAITSPIGLFCGRVANFINGELYGRITEAGNPLAMKFPLEIFELPTQQQIQALVAVEHAAGSNLRSLALPGEQFFDTLSRLCRENQTVCEALGQFLNPRWPSQLFEAAGEGLLLFIVGLSVRLLWKKAPDGIFSAIFCFLYPAARITCECFKEPDAGVWHGITQGQLLSLIIVAIGFIFVGISIKNYKLQKNL